MWIAIPTPAAIKFSLSRSSSQSYSTAIVAKDAYRAPPDDLLSALARLRSKSSDIKQVYTTTPAQDFEDLQDIEEAQGVEDSRQVGAVVYQSPLLHLKQHQPIYPGRSQLNSSTSKHGLRIM
jgi:hypothetical protein